MGGKGDEKSFSSLAGGKKIHLGITHIRYGIAITIRDVIRITKNGQAETECLITVSLPLKNTPEYYTPSLEGRDPTIRSCIFNDEEGKINRPLIYFIIFAPLTLSLTPLLPRKRTEAKFSFRGKRKK